MPDIAVEFDLNQKDLLEVQKASAVLGLSDLCVQRNGETLELVALNKKTPSTNTYSIDIGDVDEDTPPFKFYFKVENMKMLSGDYSVKIAQSSVSQFCHKTLDLTYWIALESDSSYGG